MLSGGEFQENFVKTGSGVVLIEMWHYLPMGYFHTCLKKKH